MTRWLSRRRLLPLAAAAAVVLPGAQALGAGFAIYEQSVSGLGNAFAGGSAAAEDATTVFYNPAGLTRLPGQQGVVGLHAIRTHFEFDNKGSSHLLQPITGEGLTGDNGGDGGTWGFVPNAYYSLRLDSGWAFGLGVNAPFGLVTDYDNGWVGRYHGLKSDVLSVNINPSAAYKIGRHLSVGVGASAMYMRAELSNAVDFGTLLAAAGGTPQRDDGKATLEADDWAYGFNVGLLWEFNENTRAGIHYRSQVEQKLEGDADFEVPSDMQAILTGLGSAAFQDTDASGKITLPATLSLSLYHNYGGKLAVMADATWTQWSEFDELRIKFDNPAQPDAVTTEDWNDTWRLSVGATYSVTPQWPVRCGLAFDASPVPGAKHRTPRLPDNDRYWLSLGTGYRVSDWFSFDLAYTHLFVDDGKTAMEPAGENELRGGLQGDWDNSGDIFSAQAVLRW